MRDQHGGWSGANSRDDTPGTVELFNGFNQQSAIVKTLCAFNATSSTITSYSPSATSTSGASASSFTPREQVIAGLPSLATLAVVTLIPPRTKRSIVVTASVSSLPGRGKPVPMRSYSLSFLFTISNRRVFSGTAIPCARARRKKTIDIVDFGVAQRADILQHRRDIFRCGINHLHHVITQIFC